MSTIYDRIPARPTTYKGIQMRSRLTAMGRMEIIWSSEPDAVLDIPSKLLFARYPGEAWQCLDTYHVFGDA